MNIKLLTGLLIGSIVLCVVTFVMMIIIVVDDGNGSDSEPTITPAALSTSAPPRVTPRVTPRPEPVIDVYSIWMNSCVNNALSTLQCECMWYEMMRIYKTEDAVADAMLNNSPEYMTSLVMDCLW